MHLIPRPAFWFAGVALAIACAACTGNPFPTQDVEPSDAIDAVSPPPDGPRDAPRDAAPTLPILLAVQPDHGPFSGGTAVTLRGSNLRMDLTVRFGEAQVQPRDMNLVDSHRLVVSAPSGIPGTVDVTIEDGTRRSRLPMAYTYDSFYADPTTGSIAGGTRIVLHGQNTHWTAATTVMVDSSPCANLRFVGPNELSCSVPAHAQGAVPIIVTTGADVVTVGNAFTYYEASDPNNGGFTGGHITGSINVAVLNILTGDAVPAAFVWLGTDPHVLPPNAGITNDHGQVTLSAPDLTGPVTVSASAHCFATSTFISVDGRNATLLLLPWLNQVPGVDCGPPNPPDPSSRPGTYAATIDGELVWTGPNEFGPNPWYNVPQPHANERRVAYVMTTTANMLSGNPEPGEGGTVIEEVPVDYPGRGYAYSIVARPAALAVYAIAGLETTGAGTPRFTPYVMGVARSVLASPRAHLINVYLDMNIPLDHETDVTLAATPDQVDGDPNRFRVETWVDLGGEGTIPRPDIKVTGRTVSDPYRLVAQPAFLGTLADARMIVRATYGTGNYYEDPESTVVVSGILTPDIPVRIDNWVGIPRITTPIDGGSLPASRRLAFDVLGNNPNMFWTVLSQLGSSCRDGFYLGDVVWWQHHFAGDVRTISMPDISAVPGLTDLPHQLYQFSICGFNVAGFDYDNFRYQYLSQYYWTAYASNSITLAN